MHFIKSILALTALFVLQGQAFGRDGTLPIHMDGVATDPRQTHNADLFFDDGAIVPGGAGAVACKLTGQVQKFDAAGTVSIGDSNYQVRATCKDVTSNRYEVIAKVGNRVVNLLGTVTAINTGVNFKGTLNSGSASYRFDLK
jgi:hypothetical protein